jgi:hypothetical protein
MNCWTTQFYIKIEIQVKLMELKPNQAAIILEASDEGEISVDVAAHDIEGLAASLCQVIAQKLSQDETFQAEILAALEDK